MSLINCEICLHLICCKKCFIVAGSAANQIPGFKVTNAEIYVSVINLSTEDNIKLLKQLESSFKRTIIWTKYLCKPINQAWHRYLDVVIDVSLQGVNRIFA